MRQRESKRSERYQVAETVSPWNESLYVEIDFLSACLWMQIIFPAEVLVIRLANSNIRHWNSGSGNSARRYCHGYIWLPFTKTQFLKWEKDRWRARVSNNRCNVP